MHLDKTKPLYCEPDEFRQLTDESCATLLHHTGVQGVTVVLLVKEVASHLGVHGAERVVQQVDVCVLINRSKQRKAEGVVRLSSL